MNNEVLVTRPNTEIRYFATISSGKSPGEPCIIRGYGQNNEIAGIVAGDVAVINVTLMNAFREPVASIFGRW